MNRSFKELNTKDFKISDIDYAELNFKLNDLRLNYKKGKSSYDFMRYYEKYLYQRKDFREPEDEIERLKNFSSIKLNGEFDTSYYEENFKNNIFNRIELKTQKLRGRKHLRSSKLYKNKIRTKNLIDYLITPLEEKIKYLLDSNFIITKVEEIQTLQFAEDKSACWHFDPVPMGYGKVFFYFSSSSDTDGKTEFLPLNDSLEIIKQGYNNVPISKRTKDISELTSQAPIKIGDKGKYMIFFSGLMLHKGSYPKYGVRKILSINFLRSPYSWREAFDQIWSIDKLTGKWTPSNWPKHIY